MEPLEFSLKRDCTGEQVPPPDEATGGEPAWKAPERTLDEGRLLVLDGHLVPADEYPLRRTEFPYQRPPYAYGPLCRAVRSL